MLGKFPFICYLIIFSHITHKATKGKCLLRALSYRFICIFLILLYNINACLSRRNCGTPRIGVLTPLFSRSGVPVEVVPLRYGQGLPVRKAQCKIKPSPVGEGGPLGVLKPLFSRLGVLVKRWMRRLRKRKQCSPHPSTPLTPSPLEKA